MKELNLFERIISYLIQKWTEILCWITHEHQWNEDSTFCKCCGKTKLELKQNGK